MAVAPKRKSNIEALRILCMLFIIGGHLIRFGICPEYDASSLYGGGNYLTSRLLYSFFIVAVDVFVLISGYFGIKLHLRKLGRIWLMVLSYSLFLLAYKCLVMHAVSAKDLSYVFPILSKKFWFISVYFVLCLMSPVLNFLCERLSAEAFRRMVFIGIMLFYGWATFCYLLNFEQLIPDFGGGVVNFSMLYLIGRYIKKYYQAKKSGMCYFFLFFLCTLLMAAMELVYSHLLGFGFSAFENDNSLFVVLSSVFLFLGFLKTVFYNSLINKIAVNCLSVYVFHMNDVVMPKIADFLNLSTLIGFDIVVYCLVMPPLIYIAGFMVEKIRRGVMGKAEEWIVSRVPIPPKFKAYE